VESFSSVQPLAVGSTGLWVEIHEPTNDIGSDRGNRLIYHDASGPRNGTNGKYLAAAGRFEMNDLRATVIGICPLGQKSYVGRRLWRNLVGFVP